MISNDIAIDHDNIVNKNDIIPLKYENILANFQINSMIWPKKYIYSLKNYKIP
jgi:hypothetical protein